jgi:hypothetical protein
MLTKPRAGRTLNSHIMLELDPCLYTVAWIAPLEIEARAALHMFDHRHSGRFPTGRGADYVFHAGDVCGHNVVLATLPAGQEYGTGSAAALASQVKAFFPNFRFGLLVGVAAGLPNLSRDPPRDIRLGDVLVALPEGDSAGLVGYDLGKETGNDGFQLLRFGHVLATTEAVVRSAIGSISSTRRTTRSSSSPTTKPSKTRSTPTTRLPTRGRTGTCSTRPTLTVSTRNGSSARRGPPHTGPAYGTARSGRARR